MTTKSLAAIFGTSVVLFAAGCGSPDAAPEPIRPVRAVKAGALNSIPGRRFPGQASAKQDVELSFQVGGMLTSVPVDVGTEVNEGDIVGLLDPRDFQAALDVAQSNLAREQANLLTMERGARAEEIEQLKAALAEAEARYEEAAADHDRDGRMLREGAGSQQAFERSLARKESSIAQVRSAREELNIGLRGARAEDLEAKRSEIRALEAAVASAKNQFDYASLEAPFSGRVAARYVDNFQTVQAKQPIIRLVDVSKIEVTVQVPESLITLVPQVKKAICRFDAFPGREFECQITKVGSEASVTTRTYPVTVQLDQPGDVSILPGMAGTVQGLIDSDQAAEGLVVPASAVFAAEDGDRSCVWVLDEARKRVSRREVQIRQPMAAGLVVVGDEIKAGEMVVSAGVHSLWEGQQVKLLETEN